MADIIFKDQSFQIISACFEVYNEMGCGFLEPVDQECLEWEFLDRGLLFEPKRKLILNYKNRTLKSTCEPDFIWFGSIIVEIKADEEGQARYGAGSPRVQVRTLCCRMEHRRTGTIAHPIKPRPLVAKASAARRFPPDRSPCRY